MRLVHVRVVPNARKTLVKEEAGRLKVYVTPPPEDGRANAAVVEALAAYFNTRARSVRIVGGERSRDKTVEIDDAPARS